MYTKMLIFQSFKPLQSCKKILCAKHRQHFNDLIKETLHDVSGQNLLDRFLTVTLIYRL